MRDAPFVDEQVDRAGEAVESDGGARGGWGGAEQRQNEYQDGSFGPHFPTPGSSIDPAHANRGGRGDPPLNRDE
ncbi:hypothetical protein GCM10009565_78920 [Amycolatopsis albidoflavus]